MSTYPIAIHAALVAPRAQQSSYPEPFAARMAGREKRALGALFGLRNFGVNLTRLKPGAASALRHAHSRQDEFIYILQGHPTLLTDIGKTVLAPGMCAGFRAGSGDAHCLINESAEEVCYLEMGDRTAGDAATYPDDDLEAQLVDGTWQFTHRDGQPYPGTVLRPVLDMARAKVFAQAPPQPSPNIGEGEKPQPVRGKRRRHAGAVGI